MIELKGIVKIYDKNVSDKPALNNVNLTIDDGELVSVIGPSGSGKSTLLNIIGCMDRATEGQYILNGVDVYSCSRKKYDLLRKDNIGFVFQHFALMDKFTAYENIELPLLAQNIKRTQRNRMINDAMERLGILSEKGKMPSKMSGGQQQRVAIARALVTGCNILLADEPTGALDQATGREVIRILKEINASGTTVIIVTHDSGIAEQTNRIIEICDGELV